MRYLFVLLLLCVLLAPSVIADEPWPGYDRTIVYDIPKAQLMEQYGRLPGQALLDELMDEDDCPDWICYNGDTVKILVILLEYDDRLSTYSPETMDSLFFSRDYWPGGSVADYFDEVTFGNLTVTGKCEGWFNAGIYPTMPNLNWYDTVLTSLDPYIDYSQYDANGDGAIDAICYLSAGNSYIYSGDVTDVMEAAWGKAPGDELGPFDGVTAAKFHICAETMPIRDVENGYTFTGEDTVNCIVTECHEFTHLLGLPDLYDFDNTPNGFTKLDKDDYPMVDWCLMDNSQGGYAFEITMPAHHCGWSRMKLGWLDADTLSGIYEDLVIYNIGTHADSSLYMVPIDLNIGEYFLLEFRNPHSDQQFGKYTADYSRTFYPAMEYGADLFDRGLLITHIYDSVCGQPFYFSNNDGTPMYDNYVVAAVDAGYDPDRDYTYNPGGDVYDGAQWWAPYETRLGACFSPDVPGQTEFGPDTYPSSDGYYGPTGINVRVDSIVGDRLFMYVNTGSGGGPSYVCGDANGDGVVSQADVAYLIDYLHRGGPAPVPMEAGDADGDGDVDRQDAGYLIDYLHKGGPEPVCP